MLSYILSRSIQANSIIIHVNGKITRWLTFLQISFLCIKSFSHYKIWLCLLHLDVFFLLLNFEFALLDDCFKFPPVNNPKRSLKLIIFHFNLKGGWKSSNQKILYYNYFHTFLFHWNETEDREYNSNTIISNNINHV